MKIDTDKECHVIRKIKLGVITTKMKERPRLLENHQKLGRGKGGFPSGYRRSLVLPTH
jgi:hypothetical protein